MTKTEEEIRRGDEGGRLLNEPQQKAAFENVENAIISDMRRINPVDVATQHELVLSLQILGRVRGYLTQAMQTGRMAELKKSGIAQKLTRYVRK